MKKSFRLALISAGLVSAFGLFSPAANAAKITVALTGQGMSLKCSAGYGAKTYTCPTIVAAAPTNCPTDWVGIPSMKIPTNASGGTLTVTAFCVQKYVASQSGSTAVSSASGTPWVNVNWNSAQTACTAAGGRLMRDSEWMALAHNIVNVDANWSGGAVDSGNIKDGLQNSEASSAQPSTGTSATGGGRARTLSTGDVIWDIGGNVYQWTYGDMTGDSNGLYGSGVYLDRNTAPYDSQTRGMGWNFVPGYTLPYTGWSGYAPIRGGYWGDGTYAGPFYLYSNTPSSTYSSVGFRCTK